MLGDILPDLVLLAIFFAFLLRREARLTAANRARVVSTAWQRSRRLAATTGARRPLSRASAMAARAERATQVASASQTMRVAARGARSSLRAAITRTSWFKRLCWQRLAVAGRRLAGLLFEKATDVLGERNAPTMPDEPTVPTRARTTLPEIQVPRRLLRRRLRRRRRAARRRRRGGRLAFASMVPRAGAALVRRPIGLRAPQESAHRLRGDACVTDTSPPRGLLVLLAAQQTREVESWPSLASLEGTTRLSRCSVLRIVRELEERGLLDARPRHVVAQKAGAA
ncbi:MAG: hypothetical protein ABJE95_26470 [Byssovorax sp.]